MLINISGELYWSWKAETIKTFSVHFPPFLTMAPAQTLKLFTFHYQVIYTHVQCTTFKPRRSITHMQSDKLRLWTLNVYQHKITSYVVNIHIQLYTFSISFSAYFKMLEAWDFVYIGLKWYYWVQLLGTWNDSMGNWTILAEIPDYLSYFVEGNLLVYINSIWFVNGSISMGLLFGTLVRTTFKGAMYRRVQQFWEIHTAILQRRISTALRFQLFTKIAQGFIFDRGIRYLQFSRQWLVFTSRTCQKGVLICIQAKN